MTGYEIRHVPLQHTAVVAKSTTPDGVAAAMGEALPQAFEAVGRAGGVPAGPPFARYFAFGPERIDFEAGVTVAATFSAAGAVQAGELGGCDAAVGVHVGPYDSLADTYAAMTAWLQSQGRQPSGPMWETYLTEPDEESDPSTWRTEVYIPVA